MTLAEIIEKLERATDRWAAIAAFRAVAVASDVPEDFLRHTSQAERSKSDSRAMGYLLLAALTLVPEGMGYDIGSCGDVHFAQIVTEMTHEPDEGGCATCEADELGATPAIALCIAALRAREASDG